jgi:hypothetical protein
LEEILENYEESDDLDSLANIPNILAEHDELEMLMPFYAIGVQNARWNPINNPINNAKVSPLTILFILPYTNYSKGRGRFSFFLWGYPKLFFTYFF